MIYTNTSIIPHQHRLISNALMVKLIYQDKGKEPFNGKDSK